ncbi:MAG: hypothetical protein ABIJ45_08235, partial [Candidatus Zixiibacteriota bacterium]
MRHKPSLFIIVILLFIIGNVSADTVQKGNITKNLKLSFSERFRFLSWDNAISLNDDADAGQAFTRHRTSVGAQWFFHRDFEFGIKFTNEFRHYFVPSTKKSTLNEVIFDQLYIKWKNRWLLPGTLTVGRQNIILGEGFVVMDGSP